MKVLAQRHRYKTIAKQLAGALRMWEKAFQDAVPIGGGIGNHIAIENAIEHSKTVLAEWDSVAASVNQASTTQDSTKNS